MKISLYLLAFTFLASCGNTNKTTNSDATNTTTSSTASSSSEMAVGTKSNMQQGMLIGEFDKADLAQESFSKWYNEGYNEYAPSAEAMATIKKHISDYEIVAFMGTWCPDSRRETPKVFKILDEAGYNMSKLTFYGVNRQKTTTDNIEKEFDLNRVPTVIFFKDGKEVNRFVEYPRESIEKDFAKIVSGEDYKNSYAN
ncbi:thiol-disulfide isomerase/thioredoxin [Gillisia sp. Hel_I_86]|uniref:thioredoxin family protein n=1 Tax=Gillisia sp. Hel_I_86 TaxID=1249981 RepID=UPI00119A24D1|nr:thioredoxin family protein [Gillisia sp. Hel_I_86]TVZ27358.1 thiol-disulfide isomerase/thioredoxin [Gillisia sp. Hel_I_86]